MKAGLSWDYRQVAHTASRSGLGINNTKAKFQKGESSQECSESKAPGEAT